MSHCVDRMHDLTPGEWSVWDGLYIIRCSWRDPQPSISTTSYAIASYCIVTDLPVTYCIVEVFSVVSTRRLYHQPCLVCSPDSWLWVLSINVKRRCLCPHVLGLQVQYNSEMLVRCDRRRNKMWFNTYLDLFSMWPSAVSIMLPALSVAEIFIYYLQLLCKTD